MDRRGPDLCGCSPGRTNQTSNHGSAQRGSCLMYVRVVVGLAVLILGSTGGEIAITHGMKSVGEPARLRPGAVVEFLGRAVRNGWFWTGVPPRASPKHDHRPSPPPSPKSTVLHAPDLRTAAGLFPPSKKQ